MKHQDIEVHKKILNNFGEIKQARKAAEEMNELAGKLLAWADSKEYKNEFDADCRIDEKYEEIQTDELPDVLNILEQIKLIFGDISSFREMKIRRTLDLYEIF